MEDAATSARDPGPAAPSTTFNSSLYDAALWFAQAMISANVEALDAINRGATVGFPSRYLLKAFGAMYGQRDLSELVFIVDEEQGRVSIRSRDGNLRDDIKFKRLQGRYYFSHYDRY